MSNLEKYTVFRSLNDGQVYAVRNIAPMMKCILLFLAIAFTLTVSAQVNSSQPEESPVAEDTIEETTSIQTSHVRYKLYPTQNMWTFIKLDTRTGAMWQVHYDVIGDAHAELSLASVFSFIPDGVGIFEMIDNGVNGRFILHPTDNMYNFILLDQIDGRMWQIQWSMEEKKRGIVYTY